MILRKWGGRIKGILELFRKFIRFGECKLPLFSVKYQSDDAGCAESDDSDESDDDIDDGDDDEEWEKKGQASYTDGCRTQQWISVDSQRPIDRC